VRKTSTVKAIIAVAAAISSASLTIDASSASASPVKDQNTHRQLTLTAEETRSDPIPATSMTIRGFKVPAGSKLAGSWIVTPSGAKVSVVPMSYGDCPSERVCLFEHENFNGRVVQFPYYSKINLPDYGFNDQMTSFVNNLSNDVSWFEHSHGTWFNPMHCMQSNDSSPIISPNDTASAIETWSNNNSC
jgi:Peptidase inhibitor family I36